LRSSRVIHSGQARAKSGANANAAALFIGPCGVNAATSN